LLQCHLVGGLTDRGLHDRPLTPPVGGEASQALRSPPEQKRDIDPSEFIHLELVVFSIGSWHPDDPPLHGIENPGMRDGCQHVRDVSLPLLRTTGRMITPEVDRDYEILAA
jgi:hypothetical protein